jgi:hypothetical protein
MFGLASNRAFKKVSPRHHYILAAHNENKIRLSGSIAGSLMMIYGRVNTLATHQKPINNQSAEIVTID